MAIAQWAVLLGPAVLAGLWLAGTEADRMATLSTGAAAAMALVAAAALSAIIDTPRPFMDGVAVNYLGHVRDGSFPSDHATLAFAVAAALWLRRPSKLPFIWLPLLGVGVAVGWARVFLGAHYPSDVIGGALVGSVAAVSTVTPPGRAAMRALHAMSERIRAYAIASWRRLAPRLRLPGASDQ